MISSMQSYGSHLLQQRTCIFDRIFANNCSASFVYQTVVVAVSAGFGVLPHKSAVSFIVSLELQCNTK